jgi:hypothetical protein
VTPQSSKVNSPKKKSERTTFGLSIWRLNDNIFIARPLVSSSPDLTNITQLKIYFHLYIFTQKSHRNMDYRYIAKP